MQHLTAAFLTIAVLLPSLAAAQIKTLPGDEITITATIDAIEWASRTVTLKTADGKLIPIKVPAGVKRFDAMKVGDAITARYYDNIVLRVKAPDEKDVNTLGDALTPTGGMRPGATAATQRTITAKITAIDPAVPSITLEGPSNWKYSSRVADKAALKQVKVGDRLDITWTEAVMVTVDAPKK
jgi:hypothetical protein